MEALSEELQDQQYYVNLLDELIEENDIALKHRLQKADNYAQFINEQAGILMERTIATIKEREISFLEASSNVLSDWGERMFA